MSKEEKYKKEIEEAKLEEELLWDI